ncbi:MAG TPA: glycosyltransferase family 2 protein [Thermoleophilia bacterium]|nr:glycosyltransferase family 2 protein [Thermoleophilia bacterium]
MGTVFTTVNIVVLIYFLAINAVYTLLLALSFLESRRHNRRIAFGGYDVILKSPLTLPISVLMPAYNEAETIVEAVNAMRLLEYGEYEIIVVDDGSKDATLDRLIETFALTRVERPIRRTIPCAELRGVYSSPSVANLTVVSKANGGKADALNAGVNVARYPLFCAVDADAILEPDALLRVVKPFMERPRETIATSGIVRVANGCKVVDGRIVEVHTPPNRVALLQVVEYLRAFLASRVGWSQMQALFVISGAFGVFKTQAVTDAGGYRTDTVGEDMDLVLRLHKLFRERKERYRIVFIPDPVVWTEVPEEFGVLRRQRNRWHRGLLECLTRSRRMIGNPAYGPLGLFGLPYNLVFEAVGPLIEVAGYLSLLISIFLGFVSFDFVILFFLLAVGYGVTLSIGAVLLDQSCNSRYRTTRDIRRLLLFTVLENFGYRQVQAFWRVGATVDFFRKKRGWGEMRRKGFGRP